MTCASGTFVGTDRAVSDGTRQTSFESAAEWVFVELSPPSPLGLQNHSKDKAMVQLLNSMGEAG